MAADKLRNRTKAVFQSLWPLPSQQQVFVLPLIWQARLLRPLFRRSSSISFCCHFRGTLWHYWYVCVCGGGYPPRGSHHGGFSPPVLLTADVFGSREAAQLPALCILRLALPCACLCFWVCVGLGWATEYVESAETGVLAMVAWIQGRQKKKSLV